MSLGKANFILSNFNAWMGSAANALEEKNNGADWGTSIMNFGRHAMTGTVRNIAAKDIYERTGCDRFGGSYLGYIANAAAGYGTDEADRKGMQNLFGASLLTSMNPFGGCFGVGPFGGGVFGGYYGGFVGMPMMGPPMPPPMPMGMPMSTSYSEINISGGCHHRHWHC